METSAGSGPGPDRPPGGGRGAGATAGRLARLLSERELWLLGALQLLLFWRPLFSGTAFFRDLHLLAFWVRQRTGEMLAAGEAPFWDPFLHAGQPLFASPTHSVAYPTVLLQLVLPPTAAFNLEIVLHLALCGLGAYVAARVLGLAPGPALVAALSFELAGFTLSLTNLLNRILAFPHLPLAFAAWHLHLKEGKARWLLLSAAACALMVLAGFPELVLLAFAFLLAWALLAGPWRCARPGAVGRWLALGAAAAGLSAFQLLPALHVVADSSRSAGLPALQALGWSVHPIRLAELAFPGFIGRPDLVGDLTWGLALEGGQFPYVVSLYVGFPVLLLALAGATDRAAGAAFDGRARFVLAGTVAVAVVLSIGGHLPFVPELYEAFPRLGALRFPVKALAAAVLPLALLAGAGAQRLCREEAPGVRARLRGALAAAAAAGLVAAVAGSGGASGALFSAAFGRAASPDAAAGFSASLFHGALALAAAAFLLAWPPERLSRLRSGAIVALVVADLAAAGRPAFPLADRSFFDDEPALARAVREMAGEGALFRTEDAGGIGFPPESRSAAWLGRWSLETLARYTAAGYDVPVAFTQDYDGLLDRERAALSRLVTTLPWERRVPVLASGGVRAVLTSDPPPLPGLEPVLTVPNPSSRTFFLYRLPAAEPPARFVTEWTAVGSLDQALTGLASGRTGEVPEVLTSDAPSPCGREGDRVSRLGRTARTAAFRVEAACSGYLVTTIPFRPGWTATVDGEEAPVARARGIHAAVPVGAGRHDVRISYLPPGLGTGLATTALTVVLLGGAASLRRAGRLGRKA